MNADSSKLVIEAKFRISLTDGMPVVSVTDSIEALLGFTSDDYLAARVCLKSQIHTLDSDIANSLFSLQNLYQSGVFNIRFRQANGRIRCIKAHASKRTSKDGLVLDLLLQDSKSLKRTMPDACERVNFAAMMENTDDYIYFKDRNHVFTGASQTLVSLCHPAEHWTDLLGQTDYDVFPEEYADIYYGLEKQVFSGIPVAHEEQEILTKDGTKGWVDNRKYPIKDDRGEIIGLYGIARDITERKKAEEAQKSMLREVHHRVKNNLQIINSLLRLEARRCQENKAKTVLDEMQGRIRAMSILHELLYRSGTLASVNMNVYLKDLAIQVFRSLGSGGGAVRLQLDLAPVQIGMDQAIPCGLLVNEMITNSFKHGFTDGRDGEVRVVLQPLPDAQPGKQLVRLCVSDTGVGLGPDFEVRHENTLGIQLQRDLSRQIGGTLEVGPLAGPGAEFALTFEVDQSKLPK
jgi:PAS domain S-box-containing protein